MEPYAESRRNRRRRTLGLPRLPSSLKSNGFIQQQRIRWLKFRIRRYRPRPVQPVPVEEGYYRKKKRLFRRTVYVPIWAAGNGQTKRRYRKPLVRKSVTERVLLAALGAGAIVVGVGVYAVRKCRLPVSITFPPVSCLFCFVSIYYLG